MIGVSDTRSATARGSLGSNLGENDYFPQYFPQNCKVQNDVRFRTSIWRSF
jgi:hypothetical protein